MKFVNLVIKSYKQVDISYRNHSVDTAPFFNSSAKNNNALFNANLLKNTLTDNSILKYRVTNGHSSTPENNRCQESNPPTDSCEAHLFAFWSIGDFGDVTFTVLMLHFILFYRNQQAISIAPSDGWHCDLCTYVDIGNVKLKEVFLYTSVQRTNWIFIKNKFAMW